MILKRNNAKKGHLTFEKRHLTFEKRHLTYEGGASAPYAKVPIHLPTFPQSPRYNTGPNYIV